MRKMIGKLFLFTVGLTIAAPAAPAAANHLEAKMYAITKWDGGCSGSQRDSWDDMAYGWYDEIADSSWYNHAGKAVNGNIKNLWFSDTSLVSGATDPAHIDGADAAIIAWHGGDSSGVWQGSMHVPGGGSNSCKSRSDEMLLGNTDLEFAVLSSCHSMDDNMWSSWRKSFGGMHQADGFHGLMGSRRGESTTTRTSPTTGSTRRRPTPGWTTCTTATPATDTTSVRSRTPSAARRPTSSTA